MLNLKKKEEKRRRTFSKLILSMYRIKAKTKTRILVLLYRRHLGFAYNKFGCFTNNEQKSEVRIPAPQLAPVCWNT